jgi:LPS-assembly lipoprotein
MNRSLLNFSVRSELVEDRERIALLSFDKLRTNGVWLVAVLSLSLSACGLQPLYSGGSQGVVSGLLNSVSVDPIEGKNGWLMRNALNDRLGASGTGSTRYKLTVKLDDQIEGFGVRADDTVTRERRTLRARYQLVDLQTGKTVLDTTAGSDAGIDVVSSEYATIAGENTALENLTQKVAEQIVTRLSLYAQNNPQSGQ